MSISKTYQPKEAEAKWYNYWLANGFFRSVPDEREPYTIVIPPPNVTGVLHMGHMLNNTIQDVLIRRARMQGKNACWVPGTDHASIATEAKVVAMLKEQGIEKKDLTREKFLEHAWEWKEKYGGIILEQLKKLGASCDWDRTRFTMEEDLSEAVIDTFIHLYKKGWIYRGVRMVNWDPKGKTAVSDEEVIRKEVNQKLYYIRYKISPQDSKSASQEDALSDSQTSGLPDYVVIATTRPETIMADAAVFVNPNDERYKHLHGKSVSIPLVNRVIPIMTDEYVTMDFGTGCLKVTPAHDLNDYELGQKHHLQVIDILNDDGSLNNLAQILVGEDRFAARKKIAAMLEEAGALEKVEEYKSQVGFSERTDAVIEPRLSMQWFCKMDEMAKPALADVLNGDVKLIPDKFVNTYRHWMENVQDWCISRQLWWGQRIPAWYNEKGQWVVAKTESEARAEFAAQGIEVNTIRQEEDVVDTWFSSWLWPISVFDGFKNPDGADINYYYPTNDLVTAPEILFFWVARMIMAGHEFRGQKPFTNVYLTGIVRDKLGRKMSKSLGNSPDPLGLIEQYGADGVRVGILLSSPAGNDLMFDESYCEQGRNFANKVWNAFRLVKGWEVSDNITGFDIDPISYWNYESQVAVDWFEIKFNSVLTKIENDFSQYRLSEALTSIYKLVWEDFCAWYLEIIKPKTSEKIDKTIYDSTLKFFENILKILHPFMPFLTEELWQDEEVFGNRSPLDSCTIAEWPKPEIMLANAFEFPWENQIIYSSNVIAANDFEKIKIGIAFIRNVKQQLTKVKEIVSVGVICSWEQIPSIHYWKDTIEKLAGCILVIQPVLDIEKSYFTDITYKEFNWYIEKPEINALEQIKKVTIDIDYYLGLLEQINKKLKNEKFILNAKVEVLEKESKKKNDTLYKIENLKKEFNLLIDKLAK